MRCWISVPLTLRIEDSGPGALAGRLRRQRAQLGEGDRLELDLDLGDAVVEPLVGDRLGREQLAQLLEHLAAVRDAGGAGALVLEQELGVGPAAALDADQVAHRHLDVLEVHLVDLGAAVDRLDRAHRDPRRAHVGQDERDAFLLLGGRVGPRQHEDPVGPLRRGDPRLGAVDDVRVTLAHGTGRERGEVGAGAGLGVALAPELLAREDLGQVARALLVVAELHDHRRDHLQPERQHPRRPAVGDLLAEDVPLHRVPAGAPVLRGPVRRDPALLEEDPLPARVVVLLERVAGLHLAPDVGRQVLGDERPHLVAERALFGAEC